jgi:DNA-binding MarR family transcriptional regulator
MMSDRALDTGIVSDYRRVYRALEQQTLPMWLKLGLTMAQLKALVVVSGADGISVTALGSELSIGQPSASMLVDQLVQGGHAERRTDPADRRRAVVTATDSGKDLLGELRHGRRQTLEGWLSRLPDNEADALARGLAALADVADDEHDKE